MWPGPRTPTPPRPPLPPQQQQQAYLAGPPGQWAGQWGVPPPASPIVHPALAQGWDQQNLAANFQTMTLQQPPQQDWYFDTGATSNIASDAGILSTSFAPSGHSPLSIIVGNGNLLPVTAIGNTVLPHKLHLNNVLVSPDLIKNLISVRQFTTDNNCSVEFDPFDCSVKDLPTRSEIVRCDSSGPLYPLRLPASALLASTTPSLWHQRLGLLVILVMKFWLALCALLLFDVTDTLVIIYAMLANWVVMCVSPFTCQHLAPRALLS